MVTLEQPCWVCLSPLLLSVICLVMMSQFLPQFFHHKIDALCFIFLSLILFCTDFVCPPPLCPLAMHSVACYSILVTLIAQEHFVKTAEMKNHKQYEAVLLRLAASGPVIQTWAVSMLWSHQNQNIVIRETNTCFTLFQCFFSVWGDSSSERMA